MRCEILKYYLLSISLICAVKATSQTVYGNRQFTKGSMEFIDSVMTEDFVVFKAFHDLRAISPDDDYVSKMCYFTDYNGRPNWKPIIVKNSAIKKGELICMEFSETTISQDKWYMVDVYRYEKCQERGDTITNVKAKSLSDLNNKLCDKCKQLRFVYGDIVYMNNWFHKHIPEHELYYPSIVELFDGFRELNAVKSFGFIIIYTSEDYTPLPARYRRMIL